MEKEKILKVHERQLGLLKLLAKVGIDSPFGKLIRLGAYFMDLPLLTQEWRDYLYLRKENISDKFLGLDQALIYTSYNDAKKLIHTVPQQRENYLGPVKLNARSFFLGNTLSLGTNGEEHEGIRALFFQVLPDPAEKTAVLAELVEQALDRAVNQKRFNVKEDIPQMIVALLHKLIFDLQLSEEEIVGSVAYIDNLGLATIPDPFHKTLLSNKTRSHIEHRRRLLETYKKSPKYQDYLAIGASHQLSEPQVMNQLFDMIHIAGTAGTSALLGSVFGVLCQDETLRDQVSSEMDAAWDGKGTPDARAIKQLELTEKVILETARLYPPVRFLNQLSTESQNIEIAGQKCPFQKGTRLVASIFTANRDPEKYESPDTFKVTRDYSDLLSWNGENRERNCPGKSLSINLIKMFCLYTFKQYKWDSFSEVEWDLNKFGPFTPNNLVFDGFAHRSG
ncbi:MAG: cytochrome P450 [Moorea sp. SIO2B7]|nr:cytochrome P450 [Moorena sp. SIO2B7]